MEESLFKNQGSITNFDELTHFIAEQRAAASQMVADNDKVYDRKRFRFKKKVLVTIPPKVLESQQKDTAEQELIFRKQRSKRR